MRDEALERAIGAAGGTKELARRIGITPQAVSQWKRCPAQRAIDVERATGGEVRRQDLRPDFYPVDEHAA